MNTFTATNQSAAESSTPGLLDAIRELRSSVGDGLNDHEFTRLVWARKPAPEAGFGFLSFLDGCITLSVPKQDLSSWYPEKGWIVPEKERIARAFARKYEMSIHESPDIDCTYSVPTDSPEPRHHFEFGDARETLIVAHPWYLKIRLFESRRAAPGIRSMGPPRHFSSELLQDLAALYQPDRAPLFLKRFGVSAVFVLLLGVAAAGCSRSQAQAEAGQLPPPEVATIEIAPRRIELTTELSGRTSAYRVAEVRPQVNGLIQKRLFEEGSDVEAGDALYQIDPAPFEAALENAQAALGRAEANLPAIQSRVNRYEQALAAKAVSQQDYDDAAAALKQAQADVRYYRAMVESARIQLNYARVVSPISGRIGASSVTDGAIVTAYQPTPLATIQQLDPIYVDLPQSTMDLLRLQRRLESGEVRRDTNVNKVRLILGDGTAYPITGTLQFRDVSVDHSTASITLRTVFPNPDKVLLPGMFVRAIVQEGVNEAAILVPQQAVMRDTKGNPLVMVVKEGKVEPRGVALDRAIEDQWLVTSGLNPGDHVIVEGLQQARPGAAVREVPLGKSPSPQVTALN